MQRIEQVQRMQEEPIRPRLGWYLPAKAAGDFLCALLLVVSSAPVLAIAALCVRLTSKGPVIYSQVRMGKDGRVFRLYKLRSMLHNAEALTGPVWAASHDPRVTPIGGFLRDTHIDELPQLWNVLRGDMSMVGPRPERPEFVCKLEWEVPRYRERLTVKPGITGLAQLLLPADSDLGSVRRKLGYDLFYIESLNPWLDVRILMFTAVHVAHVLSCPLWSLFVLPRKHVVEEFSERNFPREDAAKSSMSVTPGQPLLDDHQHARTARPHAPQPDELSSPDDSALFAL